MVAVIIAYYCGAKPYMTYMMTCVPLAYLREEQEWGRQKSSLIVQNDSMGCGD